MRTSELLTREFFLVRSAATHLLMQVLRHRQKPQLIGEYANARAPRREYEPRGHVFVRVEAAIESVEPQLVGTSDPGRDRIDASTF